MLKKLFSVLLVAVMVIGIVPINVSAAENVSEASYVSSGTIAADGTYTATSTSSYKKDGETYTATVTVTVANGKITALTATGPTKSSDNKTYFNKALTGIVSKLIGQNAASNVGDSVDAVSKATNSSKLIKEAIGIALSSASPGSADDSHTEDSSSGADYVLVSNPQNGKKYIISDEDGKDDKDKDGYVLTGTGSTAKLTVKSSDSKQYNKPYITVSDESDVFTFTGNISNFTLKNNSGNYLKFNGNEKAPTTSVSGTTFQYVDKKYFKYGSYYLVKKDGSFTLRNDKDDKVYFFEQAETPSVYTVTWKNHDGSQTLKTDTNVSSGTKPLYNGSTPTKDADAQFTYSFNGWSAAPNQTVGVSAANLPAVSGNVTYYAAFAPTTRSYSVVWKNWDNSILRTDTLSYGTVPNYGGIPTKPANGSTTYTFNGWSPAISKVTGSVVYTATFTENAPTVADGTYGNNSVAVEDFNYNPIVAVTVKNGIIEEITADANTHARNLEYLAEALDGIKAQLLNQPVSAVDDVDAVSGATYASNALISDIKKGLSEEPKGPYTVLWKNYDGSVLESDTNVKYGSRTSYDNPNNPYKSDDGSYSYIFKGWTPAINAFVTEDIVYTAEYDSEFIPLIPVEDRKYIDGTQTVERFGYIPVVRLTVEDGKISYVDVTAENLSERNGYFFDTAVEWLKNGLTGKTANETAVDEIDALTGATFSGNAIRAAAKNALSAEDTITWRNYDGTLLDTANVTKGTVPPYDGDIPTKEATAQFTYEFSGWTPEVTSVDGDKTYTAQFTETTNEYTVIFKDEDGTVLQSGKTAYGTIPVYNGETPIKSATAEKTYTFNGWDKELSEVLGDAVYTATYKETAIETPLSNDSAVSTTSVTVGKTVKITGAASGGTAPYKYAFYYKRGNAANWTLKGTEYGTATTADLTPAYADTYQVKVNVKDSKGAVVSRIFTITSSAAAATLKNNSTVSTTSVTVGKTVKITGAAAGGTAPYKYAFYYKRGNAANWTLKGTAYGTATKADLTPAYADTYQVKVDVKDSTGKVVSKTFAITSSSSKELTNNSKVSTTSVKVGKTVKITGAAEGGSGPYTYTFYYKRGNTSVWTLKGTAYGTATTADLTPVYADTYQVRVDVKDSKNNVVSKTFTIESTK